MLIQDDAVVVCCTLGSFHRPEQDDGQNRAEQWPRKHDGFCCDRPIDCRSRHDIRQRIAFELHIRRESDITDVSGKKKLIKSCGLGHDIG